MTTHSTGPRAAVRTTRSGSWLGLAVASGLAGAGTATLVWVTAEQLAGLTFRLVAVAVCLLSIGLVTGSSRLIAGSLPPLLIASLASVPAGADNLNWGRTLLVGCACYVVAELGWESAVERDRGVRPPAVRARRVEEVATVLAVTVGSGLAASGLSGLAPQRSVLLQGLVVVVGLVTITRFTRRLKPDAAAH